MRILIYLLLLTQLAGLWGCATLPAEVQRNASFHDDRDAESSRIATDLAPQLRAHPGQSGFWLVPDGPDAFAARIVLAEAADRTLDVQYYLFQDDLTGKALTHYLLRAADRGIRVRLLLDDMATEGLDETLATLDTHPRIEVRMINPYASRSFRVLETLARFDSVTRRMHNKSFTADNVMTIVGGRNVGDEYYGADHDVNFGDMDVLGVGPVAAAVGKQFDRYWNSPLAYPIQSLAKSRAGLDALRRELETHVAAERDSPYAERIRTSELLRDIASGTVTLQWGQALVFYDEPDKLVTDPSDRSTHMGPKVRPYTIGALKHDLLMFSPYFVPGDEGVKVLTDLAARGVKVRVVTNSLASTDVGVVHAGYAKYREPLLRGGVEIYEFKPDADLPTKRPHFRIRGSSGAALHTKTFVLDRKSLFVGSPNLDPRSGRLNTELGVLFDSAPLARAVADWFDAHWPEVAYRVGLDRSHCADEPSCDDQLRWTGLEGGREVVYTSDPHTGAMTRLYFRLISLLPIEGQL